MSLVDFVATPKFEEYKERFKQHYKLERREDGVILVASAYRGRPDPIERGESSLGGPAFQDHRRRSRKTK